MKFVGHDAGCVLQLEQGVERAELITKNKSSKVFIFITKIIVFVLACRHLDLTSYIHTDPRVIDALLISAVYFSVRYLHNIMQRTDYLLPMHNRQSVHCIHWVLWSFGYMFE
jgi:hypothetical protein